MRGFAVVLFLLGAIAVAQTPATPVPVEAEPHHQLTFENARIRAFIAEVPPHQQTGLHRHEREYVAVELVDGQTTATRLGEAPITRKFKVADTRLVTGAPFAHVVHNDANTAFRAADVEMKEPQGEAKPARQPTSRYCNPGSKTACVTEGYLFCTQRFCASDVTMGPGAITSHHTHATDHMLVAVSDYQLSDKVDGKGAVLRKVASGHVEYIPAGIAHQLTNVSDKSARFIVIVFQ